MGDSLDFSLGLATSNFLGPLGKASGAIASFLGVTLSAGAIVKGVFDAIGRGGALSDLSARLDESAGNLYLLERGFGRVGIGGDAVGRIALRMQQAFSGLAQGGERVGNAFGELGLDMEALKKLDTPQQLTSIFNALKPLERNKAAGIASAIFGREGAGQILQAARSAEDFADAIQDFGAGAALVGRTAAAFDAVGDRMGDIKEKGKLLFVGIAEGALPAIEGVLSLIEGIDFAAIGQKIGQTIGVVTQAFTDGSLIELIGLAIGAGVEKGVNFLNVLLSDPNLYAGVLQGFTAVFGSLGATLLKVFETPLIFLQAGMEQVMQELLAGLAEIPVLGGLLGVESFEPQTFEEILKGRKQEGLSIFGSGIEDIESFAGEQGLAGIDKLKAAIAKAFRESGGELGTAFDAKLQEILGKIPSLVQTGSGKPEASEGLLGGTKETDANALEKIGAIFTGGGAGGDARRTAEYSRQSVEQLKTLNSKVGAGSGAGSFANI